MRTEVYQQGPDLTSSKPSKLEAAVRKIRNDAHRLLGDLNRAKGDSQEAWITKVQLLNCA
jgi:hypothetical protein